jgi:hypothetical protein
MLAYAQTSTDLQIGSATYTPANVNYIYVPFSLKAGQGAIQTVTPPEVSAVTMSPAGGPRVTRVDQDRRTNLVVILDGTLDLKTNPQVCFTSISYTVSGKTSTVANLCQTITSPDIKAQRDAILKELQNVTKTSTEKDIFASGFVTTASSGSQGGAQIALNPDLGIKGMTSFLNINKSTQTGADPKNFEAGTRYRFVHSLSAGLLEKVKDAPTGGERDELIRQAQQKAVAGLIWDFAAKLEGEATNFNVSNFVGESALSFRSLSKGFGGNKGYLRSFVMPLAFEGGKNLNSQGQPLQTTATSGTAQTANPLSGVNYVARYKAGLGFTLFYEDWDSSLPLKRADVDVNAVGRYLFLKESAYDSKAKIVDTITNGFREYVEIALKLYVGQSSAGRYGLKLSYDRGSLPPVFARVKTFQFGFLFESAEDSSKK